MSKKSTGKAGIGARLLVLVGGIYRPISNITTMSVGGVTMNMIDATQMDSPDFYSENKPGLKTSADWTFTIQWNPADATHNATIGLAKIIEDRVKTTFRLDPSALGILSTLDIDGYVSGFGNATISPESLITREITIHPTGRVRIGSANGPSLNLSQGKNSGYLSLL